MFAVRSFGKDLHRGLQTIVGLLGNPEKLLAKYDKELEGVDTDHNKSRVRINQSRSPEAMNTPTKMVTVE